MYGGSRGTKIIRHVDRAAAWRQEAEELEEQLGFVGLVNDRIMVIGQEKNEYNKFSKMKRLIIEAWA
jgi:hypothetical protein